MYPSLHPLVLPAEQGPANRGFQHHGVAQWSQGAKQIRVGLVVAGYTFEPCTA